MVSFTREGVVSATPEDVFRHWVDGEGHALMTGAAASSDARVGGAFDAWDGFIAGTWTALEGPTRIAFRWRTTAWPEGAEDSTVEVTLEPHDRGCRVVIRHEGIPDGQPDYDQGWIDHYLTPMASHFGGR